MSRPLVLKQLLANVTFSRVQVTRKVLTLVFDSTLLRLIDTVWSTSDSSRAAAGAAACVPVGMIWLTCGDCSRSQRTL